jgi:mRNA interferase MazF
MTPKTGDVFIVDLGFDGKVRPVVVVSREDPDAPRALSVVVPLTSQFRGSRYEVKMPRVPWLNLQSFANVQAHRLGRTSRTDRPKGKVRRFRREANPRINPLGTGTLKKLSTKRSEILTY